MFSGLPEGRLRPRKGVLSALRFWRGASRCASLADLYCAFGMAFLRCCYPASTRILAGKPPRAMWSAATLGFISHESFHSLPPDSLQPLYATRDGPKTFQLDVGVSRRAAHNGKVTDFRDREARWVNRSCGNAPSELVDRKDVIILLSTDAIRNQKTGGWS
jgi:hypothetical protein